jgi:hypothetical protein
MKIPSDEHEVALVQHHVDKLMEHFDTVQVFVSKHNPVENRTEFLSKGAGNNYARYGQVKQWVIEDEEAARCSIRNLIREEEGDE